MRIFRNTALIGLCIVLWGNVGFAAETQEIVRALMGIGIPFASPSGENDERAAIPFDRVKAGERFRIYVIPEPDPGYIYVVYKDQEAVGQLNPPEQMKILQNQKLTLPSLEEWYQFDASSQKVWITLICSPNPLPELETILGTTPVFRDAWEAFEKTLIEQSQMIQSDAPNKPWPLAGTLRDPTLKECSGKTVVVRKYEFSVK